MVVLAHRGGLGWLDLQENISGEKRLSENDGFAPIFMSRIVAGQRCGYPLTAAVLHQLLFPAGFRMRDKPEYF